MLVVAWQLTSIYNVTNNKMSKVTILIVGLILVILLIISLRLIIKPGTRPPSLSPTPMTPTSITPTPPLGELQLLKVGPPEDPQGVNNYSPIQPVIFIFDKSLNFTTLNVETSPKININIDYRTPSAQLTISPKGLDSWEPGKTYTITIKKGLRAVDGSQLKEEISYQIQAKLQTGE